MPLMRILAALVAGLQVFLAAAASVSMPDDVYDIPSSEFIAVHAFLIGLILLASATVVCAAYIRSMRDLRAIGVGLLVPIILGVVICLGSMVATDLFGYSWRRVMPSTVAAFAFSMAVGACCVATYLMQSKLAGKIGESKADWEIGPVRPAVFWFYMSIMTLNVLAETLWLKEIVSAKMVTGGLIAIVMIAWMIADHADNKFKELMAA